MFVRGTLFIITVIIILCIISPVLTGVTFLGIIPIILFAGFFQRWMRTLQRTIQAEKAAMNTVAEESFANIRTVKAFSNEDSESVKFDGRNMASYEAGKTKGYYQALFGFVTQLLLYGAMATVIYVAAKQYEVGKISIGEISSFLLYMLMLVFNFAIVAMVFGNVASAVGASDKIYEMMEYVPEIICTGGEQFPGEFTGKLELKNVRFTYPSKRNEGIEVLKGVSLTVDNDKKRVVALCG